MRCDGMGRKAPGEELGKLWQCLQVFGVSCVPEPVKCAPISIRWHFSQNELASTYVWGNRRHRLHFCCPLDKRHWLPIMTRAHFKRSTNPQQRLLSEISWYRFAHDMPCINCTTFCTGVTSAFSAAAGTHKRTNAKTTFIMRMNVPGRIFTEYLQRFS